MNNDFVLRAHDRGFEKFLSTGEASSYIAGHPEGMVTRHSSFNFGAYQSGVPGFGRIRVFGEEVFSGTGSGYNMHRHHDFIICAFVLAGTLTHVNTVGNIDQLGPNDFYAFSAGSGGKHSELNLASTDMQVLYLWVLPDRLLTPPSYTRSHFDASTRSQSAYATGGQCRWRTTDQPGRVRFKVGGGSGNASAIQAQIEPSWRVCVHAGWRSQRRRHHPGAPR